MNWFSKLFGKGTGKTQLTPSHPNTLWIEQFRPGKGAVIGCNSPSPNLPFQVVFEDDRSTGYFYGLDRTKTEQPILDALHIYNVESIADKHIPSVAEIIWSSDGMKAGLLINGYPHAVFDFQQRKSYCRTGFPPPDRAFTDSHDWDDKVMELFR